jgi:hypothetical protein
MRDEWGLRAIHCGVIIVCVAATILSMMGGSLILTAAWAFGAGVAAANLR